ncbi:MAG: bifunctional tRNA pseudouridine(32) synthase/ribosomal large subunit pseudouridine synthase RluA [Phycisphaerales bacterium]|nr:bifunctional tRNA pseudouridine(32) synthase/ribosomal large subunit pseudouridine synthase RluA [Phycisphaerales bacterium]MCB9835557.1 RNA pseudouridine synthase [Phycisphaera sp.]
MNGDPASDPLELRLVHVDQRFVVVDKPAGLLSVPGRGPDKADCVIARVLELFPEATGPMVVHRLDMDTSGLLVVALDAGAQRDLSVQFQDRLTRKAYVALVDGIIERDTGYVDLPLRVDWPNRPIQIVCMDEGKPAQTEYRVLARETERTRLELIPVTGRTHQLRVHCADPQGLGAPILGDRLYAHGPARDDHPRLMLHAARLSIRPPGSKRLVDFESEVPF